jgi:hypothetical protein
MRVVITAVGLVSSIGIGKEEFWAAITEKLTTPNEKKCTLTKRRPPRRSFTSRGWTMLRRPSIAKS